MKGLPVTLIAKKMNGETIGSSGARPTVDIIGDDASFNILSLRYLHRYLSTPALVKPIHALYIHQAGKHVLSRNRNCHSIDSLHQGGVPGSIRAIRLVRPTGWSFTLGCTHGPAA